MTFLSENCQRRHQLIVHIPFGGKAASIASLRNQKIPTGKTSNHQGHEVFLSAKTFLLYFICFCFVFSRRIFFLLFGVFVLVVSTRQNIEKKFEIER